MLMGRVVQDSIPHHPKWTSGPVDNEKIFAKRQQSNVRASQRRRAQYPDAPGGGGHSDQTPGCQETPTYVRDPVGHTQVMCSIIKGRDPAGGGMETRTEVRKPVHLVTECLLGPGAAHASTVPHNTASGTYWARPRPHSRHNSTEVCPDVLCDFSL
ncbi:hypothetical protein NDU88_013069 [Pleurodeles waltl]|uniref:Uncharacterized protein n=1 Tax=Pleurodeles waltl TaxID=8319 RepID=A0AAV7R7W9_PLEWA|nr:hypothetical protein NDU88_013069 [Pleurodeles waltl]